MKWRSRCTACKKIVDAVLDKVIQRRRASCSHCVRYGFKPGLPAFLYLMVHVALGAAKVGICNEGSGRIRDHERNGWKQVLIRPLPGYHAMRAEQHVLDRWLLLELPQGVSRLDMPQGGWTETVALCDRTMPKLRKDLHAAIDATLDSTLEVRLDEPAENCGSDEDSGCLF